MTRQDGEIDDALDLWHAGAGEGLEIHEFLGMTWGEYRAWAEGCAPDDVPTGGRVDMKDAEILTILGRYLDLIERSAPGPWMLSRGMMAGSYRVIGPWCRAEGDAETALHCLNAIFDTIRIHTSGSHQA